MKKRGSLYLAYPVAKGSRIARLSRISNAEAHAIEYTKSIYKALDIKLCFTVRKTRICEILATADKRQFNVFSICLSSPQSISGKRHRKITLFLKLCFGFWQKTCFSTCYESKNMPSTLRNLSKKSTFRRVEGTF